MNWRSKARLAKVISRLPSPISYEAYYLVQRHFGALRSVHPEPRLEAGVAMINFIGKHRQELAGTETFLETGTGRYLSVPMSLWLCGALRTITVDLNPYLKPELVFEEIEHMKRHREKVIQIFGRHSQGSWFRERFELLINFRGDIDGLLSLMNVRYVAPADARRLDLAGQSVDYHVSFGVIEHVSRDVLDGIFFEARRVLKATGLAVHYATLADLFSAIDNSISPVNFLQFNEEQWRSIAGNRFMYHNRLRIDELRRLFERTGFSILECKARVHPESLRLLKAGALPLDERFKDKDPEINASQNVWLTAASRETQIAIHPAGLES